MYYDSKWVRIIMNTYWVVVAIHLLGQCAVFFFMDPLFDGSFFVYRNIIIPALSMAAVIAPSEWIYKYKQRSTHVLPAYLSLAGAFMSATAVYVSFDVRVIPAAFLVVLSSSILFFSIRLILFSAVVQLIGYVGVYIASDLFRNQLKAYDVLTFVLLLAANTLVTMAITQRGKEIANALEHSFLEKKDLYLHNERMKQLARTDYLTQLYNRAAFDEIIEQAVVSGQDMGFSLALIDLDNFKEINDTYGHIVGDGVLARASSVIRESCPVIAFAARYGGEEFAVVFAGNEFEQHQLIMESIRSKVAALPMPEMSGRSVTISCGLGCFNTNVTKEACIASVDALLYEAKRSGKNKVVTSEPAL
ncbi:GGDEF domain-containing protein [Paenibacillus sp. sgz500958]|uniref:GGDEF domain-containing protein n=1 Tax=Paenibacillus sp. sgz500958 TaxID=3242475 RepID=UPI0036D2E723